MKAAFLAFYQQGFTTFSAVGRLKYVSCNGAWAKISVYGFCLVVYHPLVYYPWSMPGLKRNKYASKIFVALVRSVVFKGSTYLKRT